ncbi:MAG TPA: hypothetical protein VMV91_08560 [Rhodocyclaceae bacterium]|nr:hypothetical protein [Rhodocyclaceae bacterium]
MLSFVLSTLTFFIASFYLKRRLGDMDLPSGMTRNLLVFTLALAISYFIGFIADKLVA